MRPLAPLFLPLLSMLCGQLAAQAHHDYCGQQQHVLTLLRRHHYSPPDFSGQARTEVIDLFLRGADEKNVFFLRSDVDALEALSKNSPGDLFYCEAIQQSYSVCMKRLTQLDSIAAAITAQPLALDGADTLHFVYQKKERFYCQSLDELQRRIRKRVKYEALQSMHSSLLLTAGVMREEPTAVSPERARQRAVEKFRKSYALYRDSSALRKKLADCMSDALARRCDPHSSFLNTTDLTKYKRALSTHEDSFGFTVTENKTGEPVIADLVPGGPAWKNDQLEEGDVIAAVGSDTTENSLLTDLGLHEINDRLEDPEHSTIRLSVLKKDRRLVSVTLSREKITSVDNALSSYVVNYQGRRMGYIPIPSFYLDQENESHNGCANDVAKEILELRADSIEGIILDLRFNGGGSMREAIALAGIFIDEGPVAIYRHRGEKPFLLKDLHRGTVWDGPLVVMINAASASASEFVASALQDYNRAVVVGSESFGKGTAQNLIPADTVAEEEKLRDIQRTGVIKITSGKFYRVTARSHQGKGIVPDLAIPGIIEKVIEREATYPFFLGCDSLQNPADYQAFPPLPIAHLNSRSAQRMRGDARWLAISGFGDSLQAASRHTEKVPLSMRGYADYQNRQRAMASRMEQLFNGEDHSIVIRNNSSNELVMAVSPFLARQSKKTIKGLERDITFHETVRITSDLVEQQNAR